MRKGSYLLVLLFLAAGSIFLASPLLAQVGTTGTIVGTIRDSTGALIPGANVTVTDERTSNSRSAVTDDSGFFQVSALLPSSYLVEATLPGFKTYIRRGIALHINETLRLDIELQVGEVTESIEVLGAAPLLQTADSTVGTVVGQEKVRELPLNGRNFVQLALLVPGAIAGNNSGRVFIVGGSSPSISGNRSEMNNFTLDGVSNNEQFFKFEAIQPSIDSIQEFKVQTNITSAQFGVRAGANVNVATKSGTNDFHGVLFAFHRNDNLDATDFFAARKPEFKHNQFGANVGGPILKNRTFFFFSYEGFRVRRGQNLFSIVPTPAQLAGNLALDHTGAVAAPIFDPLTTRPDPNNPGQFIRDPFPNNEIPAGRIDPVSKAWAKVFYPVPNLQPIPGAGSLGPGRSNNVNTQPLAREDEQFIIRGDHRLSDSNQIYIRYADSRRDLSQPPLLQTVTSIVTNDFQNLAVSDTHTFSPTTLLDFKFGYTRDDIVLAGFAREDGAIDSIFAAGLTGVPRKAGRFDHPVNFGIPGFAFAGLNAFPIGPRTTLQWLPNLFHARGRHTINFGFDLRHEESSDEGPIGSWDFDALPTADPRNRQRTGQALGSFLLGLPSTAARIVGTTAIDSAREVFHVYLQDDIRITNRLTLNLGLRYELSQWYRGANEGGSKLSWFDITVNPNDPDPRKRGAFVWEGTNPITGEPPNARKGFLDPDRNNLAPRLGVAYRLAEKATIRAGYGIFYDSNSLWENSGPQRNWPFGLRQSVSLNRAFGAELVSVAGVFPELDLAKAIPSVGATVARTNRVPYVQQWNLNVQYALASEMVLDVGYIGNKGTKLNQWIVQNTVEPGPGSPGTRLPFPINPSTLRVTHNLGNSSYNALQVKLERRFSQGVSFLSSYAWGRSIDIGSSRGHHIMNRFDLRADRGLSDVHSSHIYTFSAIAELPFGRGRKLGSAWSNLTNAFLGGWQLTGIIAAQTGQPVNPVLTFDNANIGSGGQRPNLLRDPNLPKNQQTPERFFDTAAFQLPAQFTFGNSGRNTIIGPGLFQVDAGIYKELKMPQLGETGRLQFRAELFNAFNRTNFAQPNALFGTPGFGRITSSDPARQVQFGLKLYF